MIVKQKITLKCVKRCIIRYLIFFFFFVCRNILSECNESFYDGMNDRGKLLISLLRQFVNTFPFVFSPLNGSRNVHKCVKLTLLYNNYVNKIN